MAPSSKQLKVLYHTLLAIYCGVIFIFSHQPYDPEKIYFQFNDVLAHLLEYGILGILAFQAFRQWRNLGDLTKVTRYAWFFAIFYGLTDELHQSFIAGRNSSVADLLSDAIGSLAGIFLFRFFLQKIKLVRHGEN